MQQLINDAKGYEWCTIGVEIPDLPSDTIQLLRFKLWDSGRDYFESDALLEDVSMGIERSVNTLHI